MRSGHILPTLLLALTAVTGARGASVTYSPSTDSIVSPERGFYHHTERHSTDTTPLDPALLAAYRSGGSSLIVRVFYLESFVDAPLSPSYLALVDADLAAVRDAGLKAVLRFAYTATQQPAPPYGDARKERVLEHIGQLGPLLRANADAIALVQAGFIGTWGEWYYTDWFVADPTQPWNVTPEDYANRREVVDALLAVSPRPTQVRTPNHKRQLFDRPEPLDASEAFALTSIARTGHHNDCFLASATDFGTYLDANQSEYPYLAADTTYTPMGGETCSPNPPRSDCPTALEEMALFHFSFLNRDYHPTVIAGWEAQGCLPTIDRRLGYRLALVDSTVDDAVRPGDQLGGEVRVRNDGWAAPFLAREVQVLLRRRGTGEIFAARPPGDPRRWLASATDVYTVDLSACTPANQPDGAYDLLLNLPDPARRLRDRADYALPLANDGGVREAATGYNDLGITITVSASAPSSPCASEHRFVPWNGAPSEVGGLRWTDAGRLRWTADPAAFRYHVYRDDLPLASGSSFTCRDDLDLDPGDLTLADEQRPAPGSAFGYLVSSEDPSAAEGPLGSGTAGPRPNARPCVLP